MDSQDPKIPLNDGPDGTIPFNPYYKVEINYRELYAEQLQTFKEIGFYDETINIEALKRTKGNLEVAMNFLLDFYNR